MPRTEDDKGAKVKWDFPAPPINPKPSTKAVPPFPIKPEAATGPHIETVISQTSTQTRSSNEPNVQPASAQTVSEPEVVEEPKSKAPESSEPETVTASQGSNVNHWLSHFLSTAGVSLALLLCIALIFSLGFLLWHSIQRQSRLEDTVIESERRQATAMSQLKDDLVTEVKNTRAIVQERISAVDSSQATLEKKFLDSERHAAELQAQIDVLSKNFVQEKQARENEMTLLLNLTRVRINNIEKRQQELEKASETRNAR